MTRDGVLIENGRVYLDPGAGRLTDALLIERGSVTAVGDDARRRARATVTTIDLDGRTLLPGFNDAHMHLLDLGITALETELSDADGPSEVRQRLEASADATAPGEWVIGTGYDESTWPPEDRRLLTRDDLDEVSRDHPVLARRVDGHIFALNSRALDEIDFEGVESDLRTDSHGEPTGIVVESAVARVRNHLRPSGERAREALSVAIDRAHRHGVTSVQAMAGMTPPATDGNDTIRAIADAWRADDLPLRITVWIHPTHIDALVDLSIPGGFGDDRFRLGGIKRFADGSIGARTAKLDRDFADDPGNRGEMVMDRNELAATADTAATAALPMATHAIGSPAIDAVVDNYVEAIGAYERRRPLLRIEHVELASDDALGRMADAGIIASMQPNFLQWSAAGGLYESRLGTERLGDDNRFRSVLEAGVDLAFGSDNMPFGPLYGIHKAVNAPYESQRLRVGTAIEAYTAGGARAEGTDDRKGTLEPGKLGDAVVLADDPFDSPERIDGIDVELTIVGGEIVYDRDGLA